jgi:hypothetical protein
MPRAGIEGKNGYNLIKCNLGMGGGCLRVNER